MAGTRKAYAPEFELAAVKMVAEQKLSVAEVARRLGVTENRPHDWKKAVLKKGIDAFPGSGHLTPVRGGKPAAPGLRQAAGGGARHPKKLTVMELGEGSKKWTCGQNDVRTEKAMIHLALTRRATEVDHGPPLFYRLPAPRPADLP